jgi:hypothetical protein
MADWKPQLPAGIFLAPGFATMVVKPRPSMIRKTVGTVVGILVASGVVFGIEIIGYVAYPPPAEIVAAMQGNDRAAMNMAAAEYMQRAPLPAKALIPAAWILGTFFGAMAATAMAGGRSCMPASIVGGLILLATALNLAMITHPAWVAVVGIVGVPVAAYAGWRLGPKRIAPNGPRPCDMRQKNMAC